MTTERKIEWIVWAGLAFTMLAIVAGFATLPSRSRTLPLYGALPDFTLQNQNGATVTLHDLRGQTWVADVIFTRCAGQCLTLSGHMRELEAALPAKAPIKLVSFTTDPAYDTPAVLKKYAQRFGADDNRWIFLTGDKAVLHRATVDGMKLAVLDKPAEQQSSANDLFIHSEKFVLIDRDGQIRGWYDGEQEESVAAVLAAARQLARQ